MAGYIGTQAVSVNTTSATISDDLAVGDDLTVTDDATIGGTALVTGVLTTTAATVFNGGVAAAKGSTVVAADGVADNAFAFQIKNEEATNDRSFGLLLNAGSTATDRALTINTHDGSDGLFYLQGNGQALFTDGTASLPSITNLGDPNTGMYFPAADRLGLSTAGTERVVLNAAHMGLETDGVYIQVAGSSNNFWAIGSTGGNNAPGTASTTLAFHHYNGSAWNNEIEFDASGNITLDGNLKVASGKGIDFSATGDGAGTDSSELLDDYEEGTWTPTTNRGYDAVGYSSQVGRYTKIGNTVRAFAQMTLAAGSTTGNSAGVRMIGLPYATTASPGGIYTVGFHYMNAIDSLGLESVWITFPNESAVYLYQKTATGVSVISGSTAGDDINVFLTMVYETA